MPDATLPFALTRPAHVSQAHLVVSDLDMVSAFYRSMIGLGTLDKSESGEVLGIDGVPLLSLTTRGDAVRAPRTAAGLFHTAFLVPDRTALAAWLAHYSQAGLRLEGASDHLVSEALYLSDPEGNGIEIYRDRQPEEWTTFTDGTVEMATHRLDLQALYDSAARKPWTGMQSGTAVGHIHLQVGDLPAAEAFYRDVLGLKVMARYSGASFFGAGGYHHHVAANIWNSRGAPLRSEAMTGLADYTLHFNDKAALDQAVDALDRLEIVTSRTEAGLRFRDPSGIGLTLTM
ncbi:VOC family protein [Neorhizobium sp. NPDC001467]|uniref:VOC family protein n=1 Tax=Neorhizobium sp. NPDC001467 TaxID=3390595 RepID=UPI003D043187